MAAQTQRAACLIVSSEVGLHARPAAMLVRLAQAYEADIHIEHNHVRANAKSILGILTLGAQQGAEVTLLADGRDADEAVEAIRDLFAGGFGEKDASREAQYDASCGRYAGVGWQG